MEDMHQIGISCRKCGSQWRISVPLTGNQVEAFATICPCSAIIVGNYNAKIIEDEITGIKIRNPAISLDEKYLTNGQFDVLQLSEEELKQLPELALE